MSALNSAIHFYIITQYLHSFIFISTNSYQKTIITENIFLHYFSFVLLVFPIDEYLIIISSDLAFIPGNANYTISLLFSAFLS